MVIMTINYLIMSVIITVDLTWQRLVQELLEGVLLRVLAEQQTFGVRVHARAPGEPDHLHDVSERVVVVGVVLAAVELRVHDDNQVAGEVDGPAQGARDDDDLDGYYEVIITLNYLIVRS